MLDLRFIREHADLIAENCRLRNVEANVDRVVELAEKRSALTTQLQDVQRRQNEVAKATGQAKNDHERKPLIDEGKRLKDDAANLESELQQTTGDLAEEQSQIPNLTHPDAPRDADGKDRVVREVGDKPSFDFKPLDHVELCETHGLADFETAAKVSGSNFYYLKGDGALLQMALVQFAMRALVDAGFEPVITPDLARERITAGTGYIPRGPETQIYRIADSDLCLIATAEITLAGMLSDEVLKSEDLPIRLAGLSHCFRTEAGAHGRATRGLYRVHQFTKVEMFHFTRPEESEAAHAEMLAIEERIFSALEVPFRVVDIHAGDLGGPAYRKYDLEAWMPGRGAGGEYGEITSTSNCTDYQARRLNIRFKTAGQKGTQFVHMLNGTAIAAGRAIIAILENHQQADGSIKVPQVLTPYIGKEVIGPK